MTKWRIRYKTTDTGVKEREVEGDGLVFPSDKGPFMQFITGKNVPEQGSDQVVFAVLGSSVVEIQRL